MVTSVKLGSGEFAYEVVVGWEKPPAGIGWREVAGVVTDADDNVYVFSPGDHPMVVFDRDGNFIKSWGEGVFSRGSRRHHRAGQHPVLHGRRRPHRQAMHAGRRGRHDHRRPERTGGAVQR